MDLYIGMSKPQRIKTLRIPKIQYILWIFHQESIFFSDEHFLKNRNTLTRVKFRDDKESYWLVIRMLLAILRSRLCTLRTSAQLLLTTLLYWLAWALSFFFFSDLSSLQQYSKCVRRFRRNILKVVCLLLSSIGLLEGERMESFFIEAHVDCVSLNHDDRVEN